VRKEEALGARRAKEGSVGREPVLVEEDASESTPWEVVREPEREQRRDEFMGGDEGAPCAAHAARPGEGASR
jgi:hypothetical protein